MKFDDGKVRRGFISVCSAVEHSCAVDYLGTMHCWGYDGMGRTKLPRALEKRVWVEVDCAGAVTCAVDDQHRVECFGAGVRGHTQVPHRVAPISVEVAAPLLINDTDAMEAAAEANASTPIITCDAAAGSCSARRPFKWLSVHMGLHHACGVYVREGAERRCERGVSPVVNALCWGDGAYGQDQVPQRPCGRLGTEICEWTRTPASLCLTLQWDMLTTGGYVLHTHTL